MVLCSMRGSALHGFCATNVSCSWAGGQRLRGGLPTEAWPEGGADVSGGGGGGGGRSGRCGAEGEGFLIGPVRRASITLARWAAAAYLMMVPDRSAHPALAQWSIHRPGCS